MGILSDYIDARVLFWSGLVVSAVCSLLVSIVGNVYLYAILWFISGLAQGCGWPACSKLLRSCFDHSHFGNLWSWLACSVNVTGALGPFAMQLLLKATGCWSRAMLTSGLLCLLFSLVLMFILFGAVMPNMDDIFRKDSTAIRGSAPNLFAYCLKIFYAVSVSLYRTIIGDPYFRRLSLFYFVVFATRTFLENWAQLLLVDLKGLNTAEAVTFIGVFEAGGFVSCLSTGYLTDTVARLEVTFNSMLILESFLLGACLYGCVNVFGIISTEAAPPDVAGFSHTMVSFAGTAGAMLSGYPTALAADTFGWLNVTRLHNALCCLCLLFMAYSESIFARQTAPKFD
ncbi:MFS 1 domain containing protein [Trichuris trichiura]|uniref:MFS 1 domain containing protein n=1 Tax=Trichuris trichiura TaxID=36087 RepID=A0A077YZA8_TRITR|nr:MFS 1 domain containing protein [Trichuris trichiura]